MVKPGRSGQAIAHWLMGLLAVALSGAVLAGEPRLALVIGNEAYVNERPLSNALNDAQDMVTALRQAGFEVVPLENATRRSMSDAIGEFVQRLRGAGGVGIVYYSGHGLQVGGRNYLIPVDARIRKAWDVATEAVSADRILAAMDGRGERAVNLMILDACRDNPYHSGKGIGDKGLARVAAPSSTLVLYATRPGQTADDNPEERNGLFTKHLLAAMARKGVVVEEAFKYVVRHVYRESGHTQHPWLEGVLLRQFSFYPASGELPGKSTSSTLATPGTGRHAWQVERAFWESTERCGTPACFEAYLAKYPKGEFAPIARARLAPSAPPKVPERIPLTVKTSPEGARVRILNIGPKYRDGIELQPGRYSIEVMHPGYEKHLSSFDLTAKNRVYAVELEAVRQPQPKVSQVQPPSSSDLETEMASITPQLEKPSDATRKTIAGLALTVVATPPDARIQLANVEAEYYPGIRLKPGDYKIEVSRQGYKSHAQWVELKSKDQVINVALSELVRSEPGVLAASRAWTEPLTGMEFVWIPGGCFAMGSPPGEIGRNSKTEYQQQVCVEGYWIGKHEVTNAQYRKYIKFHNIALNSNIEENEISPAPEERPKDSNLPVTISWRQAAEFAKWLSKKARKQFRLPTEKEWEYAARGGVEGARFWGEDSDQTCRYANVADARVLKNPVLGLNRLFAQSLDAPYACDDGFDFSAPVGNFQPNPYGLYDMLGNVWEWTTAEYRHGGAPDERPCATATVDPLSEDDAVPTGVECVIRGGSWLSGQKDIRLARRGSAQKGARRRYIGFRLIMSE